MDSTPNPIIVAISFCVADSLLHELKIDMGGMERAEREGIDEEAMKNFIKTITPQVSALKDFDSYVESEDIQIVRRRLVSLIYSIFQDSPTTPFSLLTTRHRIALRNQICKTSNEKIFTN